MKQCEFCGTGMPDEASFCSKCGRASSPVSQPAGDAVDLPTVSLESPLADEQPTVLSVAEKHTVLDAGRTPSGLHPVVLVPLEKENDGDREKSGALHPIVLVPLEEENKGENEDEEEKRRRAALIGLGLPLAGEVISQSPSDQVPVLQSAPQVEHVPVLQSTPQVEHVPVIPHAPGPVSPTLPGGPGTWQAPSQPDPMPPQNPPYTPPYTPPGPTGNGPGGSTGTGTTGGSSSCLINGLIVLATLLILASIFVGLGLTAFAPNLSLSGSSNVASGSTMTLHGSNFLPNSSVTLTLDAGIPLYAFQPSIREQMAYGRAQLAVGTGLITRTSALPTPTNVVSVHGDGTFNVTFQVNPSWSPGQHTIHATEAVSHRSASLNFTITQPGAVATPTPEPTATPTPTPTSTPTPTPTTPVTPAPILSCANPGSLALGPVSELSSQTASGTITLCTSGSGTLTWFASWNQNQAPWLQLNRTGGSVLAPAQDQVTVTVSAASLKAGTYKTTITFIGTQSNTTQAVNVTFTVRAACARISSTNLSFTGVEGSNNPPPQTVSLVNCGLTSDWSATIGSNNDHWLAISPSRGTLKPGTTATITVAVSIANLSAGNYPNTIDIKIGSQSTVIEVTLTVNPPPTISAAPNPLNPNCAGDPSGNGNTDCVATLTNNSANVGLSWAAAASVSGVTVQANSNSIPAGSNETVTIVIPASAPCTNITITFTGPANSASVTWDCTPIE